LTRSILIVKKILADPVFFWQHQQLGIFIQYASRLLHFMEAQPLASDKENTVKNNGLFSSFRTEM